jgi:hypothetical protein
MKNRILFTGIISSVLVFMLILAGCPTEPDEDDKPSDSTVTNPLLGAWRLGPATNIAELVVFTDGFIYYAPDMTRQADPIDWPNRMMKLAVPGVNNGVATDYQVDLNANKLVLKGSYFKDGDGKPIDVTFTRIEGSARTDVYDVWYSWDQRTDPLYTLLVIRPTTNTVYASFGAAGSNWNWNQGDWIRSAYELVSVNPTAGTGIIHWNDGSDENSNYTLEENELTILGDVYTKQNL